MSNGPQEIELKLSCTPATARKLPGELTRLTGCAPRRQRLENIYFDTPGQQLRAEGIALRIRRDGRKRLQTVKCSGIAAGGLSSRPEWEQPFEGHFDFTGITDKAVRARLQAYARQSSFAPTLSTDFDRRTWTYAAADTRILIMLDQGVIKAGDKQEAICELELELVAGKPDVLYDLALSLGTSAALFPAPLSKAARGSRLLESKASGPVLTLPRPASKASTVDALQALLQNAFARIVHHLPTNCPSFGSEHLHQLRLGLRQLHALMHLFENQWQKDWYELAAPGARFALDKLGASRDMDVLRDEIIAPAAAVVDKTTLRALRMGLAAESKNAYATLQQVLHSPGFGAWLVQCDRYLQNNAVVRSKHRHAPWGPLLRRCTYKALGSYASHLAKDPDSPRDLHRLRIRTKYLTLLLASFPAAAKTAALLEQLKKLRTQLGKLNDLHTAGATLTSVADAFPAAIPAIAGIGQWHMPGRAELMKGVGTAKDRLRSRIKALRGELK